MISQFGNVDDSIEVFAVDFSSAVVSVSHASEEGGVINPLEGVGLTSCIELRARFGEFRITKVELDVIAVGCNPSFRIITSFASGLLVPRSSVGTDLKSKWGLAWSSGRSWASLD